LKLSYQVTLINLFLKLLQYNTPVSRFSNLNETLELKSKRGKVFIIIYL